VREGETLCLVGESGSGKSVTSLTVMGLLQKGALVPSGGSIKLVGEELLTASDRRLRQLRATTMAMIFQEPMTALNPVVPVGRQIDEVLRVHTDLDARARRQRILAMMEQVRLPEVERIFRLLSAPAVGRPAPAHHDRDGAGAGAEAADRGRADHGARRHHAKADPHADPRPAARSRHRGAVHHP
jgi:ABC-type arginine transport system ATPase subunit